VPTRNSAVGVTPTALFISELDSRIPAFPCTGLGEQLWCTEIVPDTYVIVRGITGFFPAIAIAIGSIARLDVPPGLRPEGSLPPRRKSPAPEEVPLGDWGKGQRCLRRSGAALRHPERKRSPRNGSSAARIPALQSSNARRCMCLPPQRGEVNSSS
jgi:hypothetical protein